MNITWKPIAKWPRPLTPAKDRKPSPFKSGYAATMRLVQDELRAVHAKDPIIQLAILPGQFRKSDGLPYADVEPDHPGVLLSFGKWRHTKTDSATGRRIGVFDPLVFPCDRFTAWLDNLRAIGLALEALRKVDRYGVTSHAEQYRGWAQLPPPGGLVTPPAMTVEAASTLLSNLSGRVQDGSVLASEEAFRTAYRLAAAKWHPDSTGGVQQPEWNELQTAKAVLDAHRGI